MCEIRETSEQYLLCRAIISKTHFPYNSMQQDLAHLYLEGNHIFYEWISSGKYVKKILDEKRSIFSFFFQMIRAATLVGVLSGSGCSRVRQTAQQKLFWLSYYVALKGKDENR